MSIPSFTRELSSIEQSRLYTGTSTNYSSTGLVRFISKTSNEVSIGKPVDEEVDVGSSMRSGKDVEV